MTGDTITNTLSVLRRAIEVIIGLLILIFGSVLFAFSPITLFQAVSESGFPPSSKLCLEALLFAGLGAWPVHMGWRLVSARQDPHGGLLSPTALIIFGLGCSGFGIWALLSESNPRALMGVLVPGGVAATCFFLAYNKLKRKAR
jgi:hypothetical protein